MSGKHSGIADLPLHGGKAPRYLFKRMVALSGAMLQMMALEFGVKGILERVADPFWFQAFGCILGFDWHSSGLTTTTTAAMKEALRGMDREMGLFLAGGKGRTSLKTPDAIRATEKDLNVDPETLVYASKISAKVDSSVVQDGFQVYHHAIFYTSDGEWAVVQQGMNAEIGRARRYHWLSEGVRSFVDEPHSGVVSDVRLPTLDLTNHRNSPVRTGIVEVLQEMNPDRLIAEIQALPTLNLPGRHPITAQDIVPGRLRKTMLSLYESPPPDFEALVATRGVGAKTLRALSLTTELVFGTHADYTDPARFSFAHGGKDGYPHPVDLPTYENTIEVIEKAVQAARIGDKDKYMALKRLHSWYAGR